MTLECYLYTNLPYIDGSKGSKTTVNLLKEFERLNVVRTWRVRVEFIGHQYNLVRLYRCNNGRSATIATDHPQEVFMKFVNLLYQKEQYYNHPQQYYHNKLLLHQQTQISHLLLRYKMLNNHLYLFYTPFLQTMNHRQGD